MATGRPTPFQNRFIDGAACGSEPCRYKEVRPLKGLEEMCYGFFFVQRKKDEHKLIQRCARGTTARSDRNHMLCMFSAPPLLHRSCNDVTVNRRRQPCRPCGVVHKGKHRRTVYFYNVDFETCRAEQKKYTRIRLNGCDYL